MKNYEVVVYKDLNEELIKSWKILWSRSKYANFFNSYEFHLVCRKTFSRKNFKVFCLKINSEIVAILPLIKDRVLGVSSYSDRCGRFFEKTPLLVKGGYEDKLKLLIDYVIYYNHSIHLSELPQYIASKLRTVYKESLVSIISINPYVDLDSESYINLKKKDVSKIRNRIKKNIDKIEHLHLKNNLNKALGVVFDLERRSYKMTMGKEMFNEESSKLFYKNLIHICKNNIVIDFLTFDKKPFVSSVGIICKGRYYACHTCYLRDYKYLIPGKMLTYFMLHKLKEEGVRIFDFVRGLTRLKEDFTKDFSIQYDFYLSSSSLINLWWKIVNFIRRLRIVLIKTKYSKDYLYLFKKL